MFRFTISRTDGQLLSLFTHRLDIHCNPNTVFQQFIRLFQQEEREVECFLKTDAPWLTARLFRVKAHRDGVSCRYTE